MTDITSPGRGQRGNSLDADSVNELLTAVLRLTADVSALRERVSIWERVLESKRFHVANGVQDDLGAGRHGQRVSTERDRLLRDVMETLETPGRFRGA